MSDDEATGTDDAATPREVETANEGAGTQPEPARQSRFASMFTPKGSTATTDPELRERMRTLDPLERKWGFAGAALPLLLSLIFIPSLLHNTNQTLTALVDKNGKCPAPFKRVGTKNPVCQEIIVHHPSEFVLKFTLLVVLGLVLLYVVWSSKRALTIFTSFLTGLVAGTLGLLLIFFGGWLLVRSWRLQRYGATDSATVRKVVKERSEEKREAKKAAAVAPSPTGKAAPTPSKRYTPKSKPRKR